MSRTRFSTLFFTLFVTVAVSVAFLAMTQDALAGKRSCGLDGYCSTKTYKSHRKGKRHKHRKHLHGTSHVRYKKYRHRKHHLGSLHSGRIRTGQVRVVFGGHSRTRQVVSCVRFNARAHGHTTHQAAILVSDALTQTVYANVGRAYHPANLQLSAPACGHGGPYITCVQQARYCH